MTSPDRTVTNWSELESNLLSEIANRINCLRDFIIFGAVCRSWRSVASPDNFNKSTKVPWLLLDQDYDDHSPRKFLNLSKDIIYRINIPKSRITEFHIRFLIKEEHYVYSSKGWFLIDDEPSQLYLLNPFLLSRIDLPHFQDRILFSFALSSSPSSASDFVILIIYLSPRTRNIHLGFWKNGDREWTDLDVKLGAFDANMTYHNGRFYVVDGVEFGKTFVVHEIDIQNSESVSISNKSFVNPYPFISMRNPFWIVGSSRLLMIVTWRLDHLSLDELEEIFEDLYSHVPHFEFIIQEIDFGKGECKRVSDLGDGALFLGRFSSLSIDVLNESRFKSNHIYFAENIRPADDRRGSVGVYSMIDGSYEPFFSEADAGYCCSSQWIEPRP